VAYIVQCSLSASKTANFPERLALARPQLKTALQPPVSSPRPALLIHVASFRRPVGSDWHDGVCLISPPCLGRDGNPRAQTTPQFAHRGPCCCYRPLLACLLAVSLGGHATQAKCVWSVMVPGTYKSRTCPDRDVIVWPLWRCERTAIDVLLANCARGVAAQCISSTRLLRYLIDRSDKGARSRQSRKFHTHIPPSTCSTQV
jgi:hypothetical protein